MLGSILIIICASLWATDALFRHPLSGRLDAGTIVFLEHVVCVLASFPLFLARHKEVKKLRARGWGALAFIGLMGSAAGTYFFTSAYRYINPSVVILLQKTQPVFAVLGARMILGERPKRDFYLWLLLALIAAGMVSLPDKELPELPGQREALFRGLGLALGAAFCWGMSTVFGKWVTGRVSFPVTTFLRFAWGLLGMAFLFNPSLMEVGEGSFRAILVMGLVPGVLAMYLYYAGLKRTKASSAAIAEMFFPVAAVIVNWRFLGQTLTVSQVLGMGLLLVSVYFINRGNR